MTTQPFLIVYSFFLLLMLLFLSSCNQGFKSNR